MSLVEQWAWSEQDQVWAAAAEAYPGAPLMLLSVYMLAGHWKGELWYQYDPAEKWSQDDFTSPEGAMAYCEARARALAGGGGR